MVDLMWEIWFTINGLWVSLGGPGSTLKHKFKNIVKLSYISRFCHTLNNK